MIYAQDNLNTMTGAVAQIKPNADPNTTALFLNHRLRFCYNARPYWSGGIGRGIVACPAQYTTGTVSTVYGSNVVTGSGTSWPVSDIVNTTIPAAINQIGSQPVVPSSMTNIVPDTWLYVDAGGVNPEVVYVIDTTPGSFTAVFQYPHDANCTITCSSLASRTLRLGYQIPNYLITAVVDAQTLLIELNYGGTPLSGISYVIVKNLYNFAPDLKELMSVVDPQQGIELNINYPIAKLNQEDPQRTSVEFPVLVAPHSMSPAGTCMFEIWPAPTAIRQLYFEYYKQPKDMKAPGDQPPPYLDPSVIIMGAIADSLRTRVGNDDMYYAPDVAMVWEQRFQDGLEKLVGADNNLFGQSYSWSSGSGSGGYPTGATFNRSHDYDAFTGNW